MDNSRLDALIGEFSKRYPNLDQELYLVLLEDAEYDLERAIKYAKETEREETRYATGNMLAAEWNFSDDNDEPCKNSAVANLKRRFPSAAEEVIQQYLEALCGNVDEVIAMMRDDYKEVDPFGAVKEQLCREFPRLPAEHISNIAEITEGNIDLSRTLLRNDLQMKPVEPKVGRKKNVMYEMGNQISSGASRSRQKKSKQRADPFIFEQLRKTPAKIETPVESLLHLGFPREKIEEALALVEGDVERAANLLLTNNVTSAEQSDVDVLAGIFETTPRDEIEDIMREVNDFARAADILAMRLVDNPRPEDSIIAIAPSLSVENAKKVLRRAQGDIDKATDMVFFMRKPVRKSTRPAQLRNLTVDLHNFTAGKAANFVRKSLENARESGDIGVINFITGQGFHSPGQVPVLRPRVFRICKEMGMDVHIGANKGVVVCTVRR